MGYHAQTAVRSSAVDTVQWVHIIYGHTLLIPSNHLRTPLLCQKRKNPMKKENQFQNHKGTESKLCIFLQQIT